MKSLSHDIAFKAKVLQLGAALQNIKTSHCRKSQAGMSPEFVHLELCCYPPPTNPTNRSITSLTERQPHCDHSNKTAVYLVSVMWFLWMGGRDFL